MPTFTYTQSSWARGELDPRLWARTNFDGFSKAARELKNVLVVPQGGVRRRFGTDFVHELTVATDKTETRIVFLEFEDTTKYLLLFENLAVRVFENDSLIATVVSPYTAAQLPDVKFTQTQDQLISVHKDVPPYVFSLITAPATFGYVKIKFVHEPTYDFDKADAYAHVRFKVDDITSPVHDEDVKLTIDSTPSYPDVKDQIDLNVTTPTWILTDRYIHTGVDLTFSGELVKKGDIIEAVGSSPNWEVRADGVNDGSEPANNAIVKDLSDGNFYQFNSTSREWELYGATSFAFTNKYIGGVFTGNEGTMRITLYVSPTELRGTKIEDFKNSASFSGSLAVLTEPIFNPTHGYPRAAGYFQNRLWLGGTDDLPTGVWGSKPGAANFFNFDDSLGDADNAISVFITTGKSNVVQQLLGARDLFVFTSAGVSTTKDADDTGITPGNVALELQTSNGVSANVESIFLDSQVLFIDSGGKIVHSMSFDVKIEGYDDVDVSILSQHLIKTPVSSAAFKNPSSDNGLYMIIVNEDGSLALFQSLIAEEVKAWTQADTLNGQFRHATGSEDDVYFIVEREINSSTVFYLERLNFDSHSDSTITGTNSPAATAISGLGTLEGETVVLKANLVAGEDFYYFGTFTVTSGAITAPIAVADWEVGLEYTPTLKPLPIEIQGQTGSLFYEPKSYRTLIVDYYNSLGITVNGQEISDMIVDVSKFDTPPVPISGFTKMTPMAGWDPYQVITISQQSPFDMFIRALAYYVQID